jgi:hypothetical protein
VLPVTPRGNPTSNLTKPPASVGPNRPAGRATTRIRTADPFITSEVLYQLSYGGGNGAEGSRTPDLLGAIQALSQLSYGPGLPKEIHRCSLGGMPAPAGVMGATGFEPVTSTMST